MVSQIFHSLVHSPIKFRSMLANFKASNSRKWMYEEVGLGKPIDIDAWYMNVQNPLEINIFSILESTQTPFQTLSVITGHLHQVLNDRSVKITGC